MGDLSQDAIKEGFRDRLREAIENWGPISSVAHLSEISPRSISAYLAGETDPSWLRVLALSIVTGVNLEWLMSGTGPRDRNASSAAEKVIPYQAPPPALDQALMESAMLAVLQLLEARNLKLSPERTVAGVMAVYEAARAQGKGSVTDADVTPLVRLLMA